MEVLFKTLSGSRLYGLAHEHSDWDYYTVVSEAPKKGPAYRTHTIVDGLDSLVVDFGTWMVDCQRGAPMALEAMFSRKPEVDKLADLRAAFVYTGSGNTYRSVMKKMSFEFDDFKRKRHVLRLALNLAELRRYGRFNPTLDVRQVAMISNLAEHWDMAHCHEVAERVAWRVDV